MSASHRKKSLAGVRRGVGGRTGLATAKAGCARAWVPGEPGWLLRDGRQRCAAPAPPPAGRLHWPKARRVTPDAPR